MHPQRYPQFVLQRAAAALRRLRAGLWHEAQALPVAVGPSGPQRTPVTALRAEAFAPAKLPLSWGKLFDYGWFQVKLPAGLPAGYLRWRGQGEATIYLGDKPHYGVDVAHTHAPVPASTRELWVESICCQSAIWHPAATGLDPRGARVEGAEWMRRDEACWSALHDLQVLDEVLRAELARLPGAEAYLTPRPGVRPPLLSAPPLLRRLAEAVDRALDAHDLHGTAALAAALGEIYRDFKAEAYQPAATLVGHCHIDLVWLWPEKTGVAKAVHSFATALRLMEQYPEFYYSYSQPASYERVAEQEPGLAAEVRAAMAGGRWELLGAPWVESDTVLPCGEALLRSFLVGQDARADWGLEPTRVTWLPDVFAYAGCLPALMRHAGSDRFFTNKISWRRMTPFPHSSFRWVGTDGSEVLAHVSHEIQQSYNGTATVRELQSAAADHRQLGVHPETLVPTGYGDGGGGPTEEMCERARRMADLAGLPRARWGRVDAFFERLEPQREQLPFWRGEIYMEAHRGTYTTHTRLKAAFRAAEVGLRAWEAAHAVTAAGPIPEEIWQRLIFSQFHDAIPGSSVHEVYDEMVPELEAIAERGAREATARLAGPGGQRCWFNPLPLPLAQRMADGRWLELPPLGGRAEAEARAAEAPVKAGPGGLENARLRVQFTATGEVESLVIDGRALRLAEPGAQLWLHADYPHDFDAWEIDAEALRLGARADAGSVLSAEVGAEGSGRVEFARRWSEAGLEARVCYELRPHEAALRVTVVLPVLPPGRLARLSCPTGYQGARARFGAPYASVTRPQQPAMPSDEAFWEAPGSRWAVVADDGEREGLALMTQDRYGFEVFQGRLAVTLTRTAAVTGETVKHAGCAPDSLRRTGRSPWADPEAVTTRLALGWGGETVSWAEEPAALAESLFAEALPYAGAPRGSEIGLEIGPGTLVPAWVRPLEAGCILRLHEVRGRPGTMTLRKAGPGESEPRAVGVGDRVETHAAERRYGASQMVSLAYASAAS
jgi:alpha-mannosidase